MRENHFTTIMTEKTIYCDTIRSFLHLIKHPPKEITINVHMYLKFDRQFPICLPPNYKKAKALYFTPLFFHQYEALIVFSMPSSPLQRDYTCVCEYSKHILYCMCVCRKSYDCIFQTFTVI